LIDQQAIDEIKMFEEFMKQYTGKKKGGAVKKQAGGAIKAAAKAVKPSAEQAAKMASQQAEMALKNRAMQELKAQFEDLPLGQQPQGWMSPERLQQKIEEIRRREATPVGGQIPLMQAGGAVKAAARAAKAAAKDASSVLPAAERDANLARLLSESAIKDRLYHATPKSFSEFKPGGDNPERSGYAIWMTPDKEFQPAAHNIRQVPDKPGYMYGSNSNMFTPGTNVMPVYASIKNPLITNETTWKKDFEKFGGSPWTLTADEVANIKSAGHDGILYYDSKGKLQEAIAFQPQQVKSAIGNRGTFDTKNPDITKKKGGKVKFTDNLDAMRLAVQKRK
jgi:hypothetical protein